MEKNSLGLGHLYLTAIRPLSFPIHGAIDRETFTMRSYHLTVFGTSPVLAFEVIIFGVGLILGSLIGIGACTNPIGTSPLPIEITYLAIVLICNRTTISKGIAVPLHVTVNY